MKNEFNFQEEVRCGYTICKEMKEVWHIQLLMLEKFLSVCKKYNLTAYAAGGTMLGAIRHKGYIPWDDDIDMDMLREDYDKFLEIAPQEFDEPFFFQSAYTDKGYYRGHAQIRYNHTAAILPREMKRAYHQGIFIDIFVIDGVPADDNAKSTLIQHTRNIIFGLRHRYYPPTKLDPFRYFKIKQKIKKFCGKDSDHTLYRKFEDCLRQYPADACEYVAPLSYAPVNTRFYRKRKWYAETIEMPFEHINIPVSARYHDILTKQYGDYMKPAQAPSEHGDILFSTKVNYQVILKKLRPKNAIQSGIRNLMRHIGKKKAKSRFYDRE